MTIDERIQDLVATDKRIQERQEALAQALELMGHMQRENDTRFAQVTRNFEITLDSIKSLENVARSHESRLGDLEGR